MQYLAVFVRVFSKPSMRIEEFCKKFQILRFSLKCISYQTFFHFLHKNHGCTYLGPKPTEMFYYEKSEIFWGRTSQPSVLGKKRGISQRYRIFFSRKKFTFCHFSANFEWVSKNSVFFFFRGPEKKNSPDFGWVSAL